MMLNRDFFNYETLTVLLGFFFGEQTWGLVYLVKNVGHKIEDFTCVNIS